MAEKVKSKLYDFVPLLLCGLSIPLSIFMWLGNLALSKLAKNPEYEGNSVIPPTRWLFSTLVPFALMLYGLRRKGVSYSGALLGLIVGSTLSIANHAFFASLFVCYITSSKATKFRSHIKRKFDKDFKEGEGQRNWVQVLCNGGMATQLAILYLLDCGSGERPINFAINYRSSWLGIAVLSAIACCNGDTWASELGTVLSKTEPVLITTGKRVPRGTNGGVSIVGLIVSFLGGLIIGLAYYLTIKYTAESSQLMVSPVQWPIIAFGGLAGFVGSLVDSLLGATVQYSGINSEGKVVDMPDSNVKHISGLRIFDNHSVNLISNIITAVFIPLIAVKCWPEI